jgi:hypothetical protein
LYLGEFWGVLSKNDLSLFLNLAFLIVYRQPKIIEAFSLREGEVSLG